MIASCESIREQTEAVNGYYNVDSLITAAAEKSIGNGESLTIVKEVSIDGETEEKSLNLGKAELETELRLFRELDLNQPALLYSYDRSKQNNIISYRLKNAEEQTGIISLDISEDGEKKLIEGVFKEDNPIYYTNRRLRLTIENGKLSSYGMTGKQKMILKDTIHYSMKGTITN